MRQIAFATLATPLLASGIALSAQQEERVRFDDHAVVRVEVDSMRTLRTLLALDGELWSESEGLGTMDVMFPVERLGVLDRAGLEHTILIPEVQDLLDAELERLESQGEGGIAGGGFFDDFRPRTDLLAFYDALEAARPDLVESRQIGTSVEGLPIPAYTICGGDPATSPAVYIVTGAHSREWIAPATIAYFADALVNLHGVDDRITDLVDGICWHIVPMANPDGYDYSWTTNRLWRKTRVDNGDGTFGVDWNRNFSAGWGGPGSSGNTNNETYRGTAAFSEPETQAIRDDLLDTPNVSIFLDVHCYSQLVLWPYGYSSTEPPGPAGEIHRAVGEGMTDAIASVNGANFTPQAAHDLYLASGTSLDWAWDEAGVYSFTYELRDTGQFGFVIPPDQIIPSGEEILESLLWTGEQVLGAVAATFPGGRPAIIEPDEPSTLEVNLSAAFSTLDHPTARIRSRETGGPWVTSPTDYLGGNLHRFELPGPDCGNEIEFEFLIDTTQGTTILVSDDAGPWRALALATDLVFDDDAETETGWSLADPSDTATTGGWVRVDPNGTAAQPEDDASAAPGVLCFVTGQGSVGGGLGEADVDGGTTTLTTPEISIADALGDEVTIACALWYSNDTGAAPNADSMPIEYRLDGGDWTLLEEITNSAAAWRLVEWSVATAGASTLQVRFIASDLDAGSLVEAAVDEFQVLTRGCDASPCPADLNGDGVVTGGDLGLLLVDWGDCDGCPGDLTGDGRVDGADLGLVLVGWGDCP